MTWLIFTGRKANFPSFFDHLAATNLCLQYVFHSLYTKKKTPNQKLCTSQKFYAWKNNNKQPLDICTFHFILLPCLIVSSCTSVYLRCWVFCITNFTFYLFLLLFKHDCLEPFFFFFLHEVLVLLMYFFYHTHVNKSWDWKIKAWKMDVCWVTVSWSLQCQGFADK